MTQRFDQTMPNVDEVGEPVRYTPTTGRVSKAKKGLKVHYCQYGCGKVRWAGLPPSKVEAHKIHRSIRGPSIASEHGVPPSGGYRALTNLDVTSRIIAVML